MKVTISDIQGLPPESRAAWREMQLSNPAFRGPCFHPALFETVAGLHPNVRVACLEDGEARGFLPFLHDPTHSTAQPIPICDYQMIVSRPGAQWDVAKILSTAGLVAWDFENLLPEGIATEPTYVSHESHSRRIVLHVDLETYNAELLATGKAQKNLASKRRTLARDLGPIRFVTEVADRSLLRHIFEWKSRRFGEFPDWMKACLTRLLELNEPGFRGILSGLYAGDALVALHFGILGDEVLFYWFPTFNPQIARYTPGMLLLQELIKHLPELGAKVLDLGPGGENYKDYFSNESVALKAGSHEVLSFFTFMRRSQREFMRAVRANPVTHHAARIVARAVRR